MDPYLEHPVRWPGVHHQLISEIQGDLNRQLRPKYRATLEERVYLSDEDDPGNKFVIPDIHVVSRTRRNPAPLPDSLDSNVLIQPVAVTALIYDEIHDFRIEIVDRLDRSVVTIIEILSPTNKLAGSYGRKEYLQKRRQALRSTSHFVEIDLLREGQRIPFPERLPPHDYLVSVFRADDARPDRSKVWPIPINLPLPQIGIPLKPEDPDAILDLQKMIAAVYERGSYDLDTDYSRDPVPALKSEQADWARQVIKQHPTVE
jgi:hypothetical protein